MKTGENDTKAISVDASLLKTEQNSSVFVWKRISVDVALVLVIIRFRDQFGINLHECFKKLKLHEPNSKLNEKKPYD